MCNLIDTPGHVDFASEVSTASRLCDGALVLVDVWEGVCTQTIAVLRRAWIDRLRPLLVINKMDRLITELQLTPLEAYHHIARLIEQVNAVMGSFFASERMEDDLRWREAREKRLAERAEAAANGDLTDDAPEEEFEEREDEDIYFSPERGNVLFASAIDGWAFRLGKFARLYADKLGVKEANLRRALWGEWYLDPKTKRVVSRKGLNGRPLKPLFVQFVLENIWRVYDTVLEQHQYTPEATEKIVKALGVRVAPRELKSKDTRPLLTTIMQQWLPLSTATFQAVVDVIPAPDAAQAVRCPFMLHPEEAAASSTPLQPENNTEEALYKCDQSDAAPMVTYVSKMFAVRRSELPEHRPREMTAEEMRERGRIERERRAAAAAAGADKTAEELGRPLQELSLEESAPDHIAAQEEAKQDQDGEVLLGFARVFASTLRRGDEVTVTLPKYDASLGPNHKRNARWVRTARVGDLYMMMGRDLVSVDFVPAGHVCAVGGLEGVVHRAGTLNARTAEPVNLASVNMGGAPILRVAVEPVNPSEMPKLVAGLKVLNASDPCAEYLVQETGEHVILTAGELHLERCVRDLKERFAKCDLTVSEPIVPFRETAIKAPDMAPPKEGGARGTITSAIYDGLVEIQVRAVPLPENITEFLLAHQSTIASMFTKAKPDAGKKPKPSADGTDTPKSTAEEDDSDSEDEDEDATVEERNEETRSMPVDEFWTQLSALFDKAGPDWAGAADRIWAFGPRRVGANVLLDPVGSSNARLRKREALFAAARERGQSAAEALASAQAAGGAGGVEMVGDAEAEGKDEARMARDFDHSLEAGFQLANLQGPLCAEPVVGMAYIVEHVRYDPSKSTSTSSHAVIGSLISAARDAFRQGLLDWSPRLKLAMYACDVQASSDVLGKVYAVLNRRRGKITSEEMKSGTDFFTIRAEMPVVESFGFVDEIRKKTSGAAQPQLIFAGFREILGIDPFWVPTTQEELEDLGEIADRENPALAYMEQVRRRKGLEVRKRLVVSAEKQRTLKR